MLGPILLSSLLGRLGLSCARPFHPPDALEEVSIQQVPVISYTQQVLGYIAFKVSHLHVLPHILGCLERIGKITIAADQYCHIVEIVPAKVKKVCSQHDIDALFHRDTLQHLGSSQANLQIWCLAEHIEEFLLLTETLRPLALVLKDIIVIRSEQSPRFAEPIDELGKVEVDTPEVVSECVIEVASVDEYCHPAFSAGPLSTG